MLTVAASNANGVMVAGSDGSSYSMSAGGGTQAVSPTATTTYTANATGTGGKASSAASVTVSSSAAGADRDHCREPHLDCCGKFVHADGDGHECHRGDRDRLRWQQLQPGAERRQAGRQPERDDYVYRQRDWSRREGLRGRERYRDSGSNAGDADRGYLGEPHVDHRGELLYVDRDRDQRHCGDGDRLGWQQLQTAGERRHAGRQPDCDHYLHCRRHGRGRRGISQRGHRDRGSHHADRDHFGQPEVNHRRGLVDVDCDRDQCHAGDG